MSWCQVDFSILLCHFMLMYVLVPFFEKNDHIAHFYMFSEIISCSETLQDSLSAHRADLEETVIDALLNLVIFEFHDII